MEDLCRLKANEFRNIGLLYGPYSFSDGSISRKFVSIWSVSSEIFQVVSEPTYSTSEYSNLLTLVTRAHALFSTILYEPEQHLFWGKYTKFVFFTASKRRLAASKEGGALGTKKRTLRENDDKNGIHISAMDLRP